jgi:multisubunit Na+/H+ antiporter MnhE subunit
MLSFLLTIIVLFLIWKFLPGTFRAGLSMLSTAYTEIKHKIMNNKRYNDDYNKYDNH